MRKCDSLRGVNRELLRRLALLDNYAGSTEYHVKILFIASMAIVTPDPAQSRKLFMDALGLPLDRHEGDDYYFSENIGGSKHFSVWPLSQAAEACFGNLRVAGGSAGTASLH